MRHSVKAFVVVALASFSVASSHAASMNRDVAVLQSVTKGAELPFAKNGVAPIPTGRESTIAIDITGFQTFDSGFPGALNSSLVVPVSPNAAITGVSFSNLSIQLSNGSFGEEFTLSTNDSANLGTGGTYWDYRPFDGLEDVPTVLGPISGSFTNPSNQFNSGPFNLLADGNLLLYVYETFNDAGTSLDATVLSGTLTITYTAVPEPTTLSLLAGAGLAAVRRRK